MASYNRTTDVNVQWDACKKWLQDRLTAFVDPGQKKWENKEPAIGYKQLIEPKKSHVQR